MGCALIGEEGAPLPFINPAENSLTYFLGNARSFIRRKSRISFDFIRDIFDIVDHSKATGFTVQKLTSAEKTGVYCTAQRTIVPIPEHLDVFSTLATVTEMAISTEMRSLCGTAVKLAPFDVMCCAPGFVTTIYPNTDEGLYLISFTHEVSNPFNVRLPSIWPDCETKVVGCDIAVPQVAAR